MNVEREPRLELTASGDEPTEVTDDRPDMAHVSLRVPLTHILPRRRRERRSRATRLGSSSYLSRAEPCSALRAPVCDASE